MIYVTLVLQKGRGGRDCAHFTHLTKFDKSIIYDELSSISVFADIDCLKRAMCACACVAWGPWGTNIEKQIHIHNFLYMDCKNCTSRRENVFLSQLLAVIASSALTESIKFKEYLTIPRQFLRIGSNIYNFDGYTCHFISESNKMTKLSAKSLNWTFKTSYY